MPTGVIAPPPVSEMTPGNGPAPSGGPGGWVATHKGASIGMGVVLIGGLYLFIRGKSSSSAQPATPAVYQLAPGTGATSGTGSDGATFAGGGPLFPKPPNMVTDPTTTSGGTTGSNPPAPPTLPNLPSGETFVSLQPDPAGGWIADTNKGGVYNFGSPFFGSAYGAGTYGSGSLQVNQWGGYVLTDQAGLSHRFGPSGVF